MNAHFEGHYREWRLKRIAAIVEWYGNAWFRGRRILELGAGHGDIGAFFWALGADVTFAEGRPEHVAEIRARFPLLPPSRVVLMDAEQGIPIDGPFDLILHLGLLYHLNDWRRSVDDASRLGTFMVLESEVCDSDDPSVEAKINEQDSYDQALHGRGSRPSAEMLEAALRRAGWQSQRLRDNRCNANMHVYDWPVQNTGSCRNGQRRWWFCGRQGVKP